MKRLLTTTATAAALTAAVAVQSVGAATAPLPPLHANAGEAAASAASAAGAAGSSARPAGSSGSNNNKNRRVPPGGGGGRRPPTMTAEHDGGPDRYIPKGAFPPSSSGLWTTVSEPDDSDRVEFLPASSLLSHHETLGTAETHLPPQPPPAADPHPPAERLQRPALCERGPGIRRVSAGLEVSGLRHRLRLQQRRRQLLGRRHRRGMPPVPHLGCGKFHFHFMRVDLLLD